MDDHAKRIEEAIDEGNLEALKKIVDENSDLEQNLRTGFVGSRFTILHYAVLRRQPEIIEFLLEKGIDPNIRDGHGVVPMFDLVSDVGKEDAELRCFELLRDANADIDSETDNAWHMSLIEMAVHSKKLTMIRALLEAGADPKPKTVKVNGKSANLIHLAVSKVSHSQVEEIDNADIEIIKVLTSNLEKNSINELFDEKYTALDIAEIEQEKTYKNGKSDPDSVAYQRIQEIIDYLSELGGLRNRRNMPHVDLEKQVKIDESLSQEYIDILGEFVHSISLAAHALEMLIQEKESGGGLHPEYRRVAAYASMDLRKAVENVKCHSNHISREFGNAIFALSAMNRMADPMHEITAMDKKALNDLKYDICGILSILNVYEHSYY